VFVFGAGKVSLRTPHSDRAGVGGGGGVAKRNGVSLWPVGKRY